MTDLLSPSDTGDIEVGARTQNMAPFIAGLPPALRRSNATGEFPTIPGEILARPVGVEELERLSAGETLVLDLGVTPAEQPAPPRYRGEHRKADPSWAWAAIGAGAVLVAEAAAFLAVLVVAW